MKQEKGTNREIRRKNRNRIFRYVCKNRRSSNPEIASALHMSLPTVLQNTRELQKKGVLYDAGEMESTGGRKARTVDVVENYRCAVGIDITRNHLVFVLTNLTGANLDRERVLAPFQNTDTYYRMMENLLEDFIERNHVDRAAVLGVGISLPGIVNYDEGKIPYSHVLGLSDFSLGTIADSIPYHTWFVNDANAGAMAEGFQASDDDHFFYLSLNNSVGGGFYEHRRVLYGDHFQCGEIGHVILVPNGKKCYCGRKGCADAYCNALQLANMEEGDLEQFFVRLEQGMDAEKKRWKDYVRYLSLLINNVRMVLDYDIVIGGYVGSAMGYFIEDIRQEVASMDLFRSDPSFVRTCSYQISESAFGAALYLIEDFIKGI